MGAPTIGGMGESHRRSYFRVAGCEPWCFTSLAAFTDYALSLGGVVNQLFVYGGCSGNEEETSLFFGLVVCAL